MNRAKELIQAYENQYRQGFRTRSELFTVIAQTAGIYGGKETVAHVSPEFISEIVEMVKIIPNRDEFFVFKVSEPESSTVYKGLVELHEALVNRHKS